MSDQVSVRMVGCEHPRQMDGDYLLPCFACHRGPAVHFNITPVGEAVQSVTADGRPQSSQTMKVTTYVGGGLEPEKRPAPAVTACWYRVSSIELVPYEEPA